MTTFDQAALTRLATGLPDWRQKSMESAFGLFSTLEEPTGAEEDWRYVDYDLPFSDLRPVDDPGDSLDPGPFETAVPTTSGRVVIVDGSVVEADADPARLVRLAEMDGDDWRSSVAPDHNKLSAANTAFAHDGVLIRVEPGVAIEHPILVEIQGVTPESASFPRLSVDIGENAEARIVVVYRSAPDTRLLMVPDVALNVGDGANLRYLAVQNLDTAARGVVHQQLQLGRDSTGRLGEVGLGAHFGRLDLNIQLIGDGCSAETVGLYFGEGDQTLDYRMLIRHVGRNTSSDVFLKGAVEDAAQSVFTGLLRIEKDAVRTSTFETNRNLVLSENAKAHSVPNLEILCDDVICGHGSSVGPLEEEHLYYVQSRGLRRPAAERLLVKGFFQEVIDRLPVAGLEDPISAEVFRRFVVAQEEGRVA